LDVMLGCTFAFKVRTQPRTKCASVIKVSNVSEIVAHVKSLIPPLQVNINFEMIYIFLPI